MESPMSRTRGRLVSFAWEIQMSHHSMASRAGGRFVSATARLLAIAVAVNRGDRRFFIETLLRIYCRAASRPYHGDVGRPALRWCTRCAVTAVSVECKIPGDWVDYQNSW